MYGASVSKYISRSEQYHCILNMLQKYAQRLNDAHLEMSRAVSFAAVQKTVVWLHMDAILKM